MERFDMHDRNARRQRRGPRREARPRPLGEARLRRTGEAHLRTTGMVVFTELDETRPAARRRVGVALTNAPVVVLSTDWRHRALRGVAWLLGR